MDGPALDQPRRTQPSTDPGAGRRTATLPGRRRRWRATLVDRAAAEAVARRVDHRSGHHGLGHHERFPPFLRNLSRRLIAAWDLKNPTVRVIFIHSTARVPGWIFCMKY